MGSVEEADSEVRAERASGRFPIGSHVVLRETSEDRRRRPQLHPAGRMRKRSGANGTPGLPPHPGRGRSTRRCGIHPATPPWRISSGATSADPTSRWSCVRAWGPSYGRTRTVCPFHAPQKKRRRGKWRHPLRTISATSTVVVISAGNSSLFGLTVGGPREVGVPTWPSGTAKGLGRSSWRLGAEPNSDFRAEGARRRF